MATRSEESKAVSRGARLLDKVKPGWFKKVHPEELDMSNPEMCILGQTFKRYGSAVERIAKEAPRRGIRVHLDGFKYIDSGYYGFDYGSLDGTRSANEVYDELGQEWVKQLERRRKAAKRASR